MQSGSPETMTPKLRLKVALISALLAAFCGALHGQIVSEAASPNKGAPAPLTGYDGLRDDPFAAP